MQKPGSAAMTRSSADHADVPAEDQRPPPLFGSWRNAYVSVVAIFVVDVVVFYTISRYFA